MACSLVSYRPLAKGLSRDGALRTALRAAKVTHQAHRHVLTVTPLSQSRMRCRADCLRTGTLSPTLRRAHADPPRTFTRTI